MRTDMRLPRFTKRAARAISQLVRSLPDKEQKQYLPTIGWLVESNAEPAPAPCIGLHPKDEVPQHLTVEEHGVKIGYNLPSSIMRKYQDHVLDYIGNQFIFVNSRAVMFLGANEEE